MEGERLRVVIFGGGTGLTSILRGLKAYPLDITAIVTVGDDGGSSGKMRQEFNMVAPGDLRRVLVALSQDEETFDTLFNYRFEGIQDTFLSGHTVGNIILAALSNMNDGNIVKAVEYLGRVLKIKGRVLPIAENPISLVAHFSDGSQTVGESSIPKMKKKIVDVSYLPIDSRINPEVIPAILAADVIVYSAGSLYTSLIANLLFSEVKEALYKSKAPKIYIGNIMTQPGETDDYCLSDHVKALLDALGAKLVDYVIANNDVDISQEILENYRVEGQKMVVPDFDEVEKMGISMVADALIMLDDGKIRHDNRKLAQRIFELINKLTK